MPNSKSNAAKPQRVMPNNIEAEVGVLGSVLIDGQAADALIARLKPEDFYLEKHRVIFNAMATLHSMSKPIDALTLADRLELEGELDNVGSLAYLSELAESVISSANGEYYCSILKRDSLIRKVINAGNEMVKFAYDATEARDALDNAEKLVYEIAEQNSEKALVKADDALANVMLAIENAQSGRFEDNSVKTRFKEFDRVTKGLKPGELILLAARPSVGKTAFALNVAANVAIAGGKVAIFSLEMSADLLVKRMLAYVSGITFDDMDRQGGISSGAQSEKLMSAYRKLLAAEIYIDDYSSNSPADILSKCRRLKREKGLDLVIVDYLQLMEGNSSSSRGFESRQVEVSTMSRRMKVYAKELACPFLVLSQMSRGIDERKTEPVLSDLRESGAIEQDADIVAFLHNPSKYNAALPDNEIKLMIKKNRNGPLADIDLVYEGSTTSFKEQASSPRDEGNRETAGKQEHRPVESENASVKAENAREKEESEAPKEQKIAGSEQGFKKVEDIADDMIAVQDEGVFDEELPFDEDGNPNGDLNF